MGDKHKCPWCLKTYPCVLRITIGKKWEKGDCSFKRRAVCAECFGVGEPMDKQTRVSEWITNGIEEAKRKL